MLPFLHVGSTVPSVTEAAFRTWIMPPAAYIGSFDDRRHRSTKEDREPPEPPRLVSGSSDPVVLMTTGDLPWPLDSAVSRYIVRVHLTAPVTRSPSS